MKKLFLLLLLSIGFIGTTSAGEVDTNILKLKASNSCKDCNLKGANLSGANLRRAGLRKADLSGVDFSGANLYGANLYGANLSGANLSGADLREALIYGADLSGVNLSGANLSGATLTGANLSGATLCNTKTLEGIDDSGCTKEEEALLAKEKKAAEERRIAYEIKTAEAKAKARAQAKAYKKAQAKACVANYGTSCEAQQAKSKVTSSSPKASGSPLKAEITCHFGGSVMSLRTGSCIGDDDFLSIKINNITKTYNYSDSIGIGNNTEGLENCNVNYDRKCIIDLPEHFEIKVWHGPDYRTNTGSRVTGGKLILKILLNDKVIFQDETSTAYKMLGLKN